MPCPLPEQRVGEKRVVRFSAKGEIEHWNNGARLMFGHAIEQRLGQPISGLSSADVHADLERALLGLREGRGPAVREVDGDDQLGSGRQLIEQPSDTGDDAGIGGTERPPLEVSNLEDRWWRCHGP